MGIQFFSGKIAATILAAVLLVASAAHAAAPMAKKQAPGYYRTMLGDFEITALSDGVMKLKPDEILKNTDAEHVRNVMSANFLSIPTTTSDNGFLINTGKKLVLVDTGAGSLFGPTTGKLVENLKASGYKPSQVDEIYITHMHPDHVGGLVSDGKMAFPNATVRAGQKDADYWLSKDKMQAAPESGKGTFKNAMKSLNPYVKAGQFKPFKGSQELAEGINAVAAKGHTPGHTAYQVESGGKTLLLWGDLMHVGAVQFPEPGVAISFDSDKEQAVKTREKIFDQAGQQGYLIGGAHLSFPGLGHLKAADKGAEFLPVNYEGDQ